MRLLVVVLCARSCAERAPSDTFGLVDRALLPVVGPAWSDDVAAPCAWSNESFAKAAKMATANHYADGAAFCLLYTSPSPRDATLSRMPSSA